MGTISHFPLASYGAKHFIETGTGAGDGLAFALRTPFETYTSIELMEVLWEKAVNRFKQEPRVNILHGTSLEQLPRALSEIPDGEPILFWLDAHYPGADYNLGAYLDPAVKEEVRLPLESELLAIKNLRPTSRDIFIIDDLRIYLPGSYQNGPLPWAIVGNIGFIYEIFESSHEIVLSYDHEGYIILLPKR